MKLGNLISKLPDIVYVKGPADVNISSVEYDSRRVTEGSLFVAIKGFNADGHDFVPQAISGGAVAVIGEQDLDLPNITYIRVMNSRKALAQSCAWFYDYPSKKLGIIGVTGTNGKTTTTYLVKAMLDRAGYKTGVIGTIGNLVGDKVLRAERTTPESLELNRLFLDMVHQGVNYVAMEVSSHSLKLHRVDGIDFEVGIFTNLTQDHLDFHKTFEDYYESKKKLFDLSRKAVVNVDDESGRNLLQNIDIPAISYGIDNDADLRAINVHISLDGVFYDVEVKGKRFSVAYRVPGKFSVYNSLAALGTGISLGIPMDILIDALGKVTGVPGRFEPVKMGQDFAVIVDYAHTPDGLENVLRTIKSFVTGRIITVFGCGGDRDRRKRPVMGHIASRFSDYCIITSDNPRSEEPEAIIDEIEKGVIGSNYEKIVDRREAIARAIEMAEKDDVVLIAGKGHEDYQVLKDKIIHFDDREVAAELLLKKVNMR
ncbi:MAG TPA: UDP-N-acetylmuramoyl-L-alanyl-D-glutamate--2,6-diaminopimelate ligase [Thermoanaerobacterales bacterium]|nr:UDP-N-acetylmuramoyl-L-alanyl-D-glutamate--2,6-diaminopimelate ligase [Thermoanaerobacterales bacterium]